MTRAAGPAVPGEPVLAAPAPQSPVERAQQLPWDELRQAGAAVADFAAEQLATLDTLAGELAQRERRLALDHQTLRADRDELALRQQQLDERSAECEAHQTRLLQAEHDWNAEYRAQLAELERVRSDLHTRSEQLVRDRSALADAQVELQTLRAQGEANLALAQEEQAARQAELDERERALAARDEELGDQCDQLSAIAQELDAREAELIRRRQELGQLRDELDAERQASALQQRELEAQQSLLAARRTELNAEGARLGQWADQLAEAAAALEADRGAWQGLQKRLENEQQTLAEQQLQLAQQRAQLETMRGELERQWHDRENDRDDAQAWQLARQQAESARAELAAQLAAEEAKTAALAARLESVVGELTTQFHGELERLRQAAEGQAGDVSRLQAQVEAAQASERLALASAQSWQTRAAELEAERARAALAEAPDAGRRSELLEAAARQVAAAQTMVAELRGEFAAARVAELADWQTQREQLEQQLTQAEAQRDQLVGERDQLASERDQLAAQHEQAAAGNRQLQEHAARLAAAETARRALLAELEAFQQSQAAELEQVARQQEQLATERDAALAELAALQQSQTVDWEQVAQQQLQLTAERDAALEQAAAMREQLADLEAGWNDLRAERRVWRQDQRKLARLDEECQRLRQQLASRPAAAGDDDLAADAADQLELEQELQSLRNRVVDLTESLQRQTREAAAEQAKSEAQLAELRRALELQTQLQEDRPRTTADQAPMRVIAAVGPPPAATPANGRVRDQALDSVMAQFEQLKRDRVRRAGRTPHPGKQGVA